MKSLVDQWLTVLTKAVCAQLKRQTTPVCVLKRSEGRTEVKISEKVASENATDVLQNSFHDRAASHMPLLTLGPTGH